MDSSLVSTGIAQFDQVLHGGLTADRLYLIEGSPGTGKTTLALQFLLEGARLGERGLYVTLSETRDELDAVAKSHGWSLEGIDIHELIDPSETLDTDSQYTMFEPSEIELSTTIRGVLDRVDKIKPRRVAFDSLSEMRLLAQSSLRYRRQILALKQYFVGRSCTVLMLDDKTAEVADEQLRSIAHGVIHLEQHVDEYGDERRRLRVVKFRGRSYQGGAHDFQLQYGGIKLFARKDSAKVPVAESRPPLLSDNVSLDSLLGDGLASGSSTLLLGPAGVGKSSVATLYAVAAARRGDRAILFSFDERRAALLQRSAGLGIALNEHLESGAIEVHQMDPGELSPGEFAHRVRESVKPDADGRRVTVVVIDSLNGYLNAMPHERFLTMQMHELLKYLGGHGIVTFLVVAQHGMLGSQMATPVDASYLADNVVLFRYFEAAGEIRQAISVVKKRTGEHERTIRELRMSTGMITIGKPLREFHGILAGVPRYTGENSSLLDSEGQR